jgi:KaiC/GvpD/RAD55 family RecA-like ATPase
MERVKTGITGLDELLEGGFPQGRNVLVSGACGAGKSIFAMQYIYKGALEFNEPGIFVTFDEMPDKIRQDMLRFGWNVKELEDQGKMAILDATSARAGQISQEEHSFGRAMYDRNEFQGKLLNAIKELKAKRIAIDSTSAIGFQLEQGKDGIRQEILSINYILSYIGMTTVLTSEIPQQPPEDTRQYSRYSVEEYVADGVIVLNFIGGMNPRRMFIRKMRGTKHSEQVHSIEITDKGINVKKSQVEI